MKSRTVILGSGVGLLGLYLLSAGDSKVTPAPLVPKPQGMTKTGRLSNKFFEDIHTLAHDLKVKGANLSPEGILSVFLSESGVNPASKNQLGYAGLNGMGEKERHAVGFSGTIDDWTKLSAEEQLPYIRKFIDMNIRSFAKGDYSALSEVGRLYLLNFTPAYVMKPSDFVIFKKGEAGYNANTGIDVDHKGYIEVADMNKFLALRLKQSAALWSELQSRLADNAPGIT